MSDKLPDTFEMATHIGWMPWPCELRGPFAIHRSAGHRAGWIISHAATGRYIALPYMRTRRAARDICDRLAPLAPWDAAKPGKLCERKPSNIKRVLTPALVAALAELRA